MAAEPERVLRAAAKVAADETGTGVVEQAAAIHVIINGNPDPYECILDTAGKFTEASPPQVSRARLHLTYASEEVFLGLAHERIGPRAAMLTGKLKFRGEMSLGITLGHWIRKAMALEAAAPDRLQALDRGKWERDEDAKRCAVCRKDFTVLRWRHHCRFCGRVVCEDCSPSKVDGLRACESCLDRTDPNATEKPSANLAEGASPSGGFGRDRQQQQDEKEGDAARELQTRVLELEEEIDHIDKRAFSARARVLRQLVLMVYRLISLGLLAMVLLSAHLSATLLSRQFGPKILEVTVDVTALSAVGARGARLASAVGDAAGLAFSHAAEALLSASNVTVSTPEVQGEGSDAAAAAAAGRGKEATVAGGAGGDAGVGVRVSTATCAEGGTCVAEAKDGGGVRSLEDAAAAAAAAATAAASAAAATAAAAAAAGGRSKRSWAMPEEKGKRRLPPESKDQQKPQQDDEPGSAPPNGKLHLSLSLYWAVMALVVLCLMVHQRRSEGLILRRVKTFCLAGTAIFALKMTKTLTQGMSSDESDDTWADVHKLLAPFVYQSILDVAGMWVKTGQYLSSRADVMPQPYLDELSKLQDAVPASPFEEVDETVREQLGRPLTELFATIEREALASASVAQVHRCKLKDGREAVIKVQHRRVRKLFLEDLRNISRLVRMVAWAEKDYDFRPIMNEWTKESYKELDFVCEAKNLHRIGAAMKRSGLEVIVPELVPEFTRMKVVVMTFCEGFKVTDSKALAAVDIDREAVMQSVTESFAYQIHIDGLFNGDPHPGNILLQPAASSSKSGGKRGQGSRAAVPVLLDWGLAKTLPDHLRIAFSRFIYAGCEHDFVSMLIAFEEIGIKLNRFDPAEDMHNIRFLLRDTQPASEAKKDVVQFHRRISKKMSRGLKNPVDAYPGELLFFLRVHVLLRGLAARLQVRQRYMDIMAPYATKALREIVPVEERATQAVYPSPVLSLLEIKVRKLLEGLVARAQITGCQVCVIYRGQTLVDLCAGTQGPVDPRPVRPSTLFCVFSAGKAVCSTAVHLLADRGLLRYDQRLSEVWPEFASNGKLTTTVRHVLTHSTGLQHAFPDKATFDRVCDWGEVQRTLEDARPAWPPGSRASYHYFTFGWLVAAVVERVAGVPFGKFIRDEIATPLGLEDSFFMGGLSACGVEASRIAHVEHKFKIPGRSGVGLGSKEAGSESSAGAGATRQEAADSGSSTTTATTTSNTDSSSSGGGFGRKGVAVVGPEPSLDSSQHAAGDDVIVGTEDIDEDLDEDGAPRLGLLATMASALMEDDPDEGAAIDGLARKLAGREYFLDPRVFNYPQMRDACIPAANGHMTAKALATLYDNFLGSLGLSSNAKVKTSSSGRRHVVAGPSTATAAIAPAKPPPLLCRARVNEMRAYQVKETSSLHLFFGLPMGGVRYSLGYQMFGFREKPKPQRPQRQHELPSAASSRASTTSSVFGNRRRLSENSTTLLGGGSTTGSTLFSRAASLFGGGESDDGTVPMTDAAAAPASRGRVRLSGLGHVGMGGSVALCDPASGLAFAMVTNKVATGRECSTAVLSLVCEELGIGDPSHFFED